MTHPDLLSKLPQSDFCSIVYQFLLETLHCLSLNFRIKSKFLIQDQYLSFHIPRISPCLLLQPHLIRLSSSPCSFTHSCIHSFNGYFCSLCYGHWGYFSKTDSVSALMVGGGLLACLQSQVSASMTCCLLVSSPSPACRGPCRTVPASTVALSQHSMCILHGIQQSGKSFGSFVCIYCLSSSSSRAHSLHSLASQCGHEAES